jgi:hypothetical protein
MYSTPIPNITSIEDTDILRVWRYIAEFGGYRLFEISGRDLKLSALSEFKWDLNDYFSGD